MSIVLGMEFVLVSYVDCLFIWSLYFGVGDKWKLCYIR